MLFAMAGAFAVFACTYDASKWATRWWVPIVAGILIGAVGTFGDLCASMLKRDIGIKDMGHLLKGRRRCDGSCGFHFDECTVHLRLAVDHRTVIRMPRA